MNEYQETLKAHIRTIAQRLWEGNCRFVFGAGLPWSEAGLPSSNQLTASILQELVSRGKAVWAKSLLADDGSLNAPIPLGIAAEFLEGSNHQQDLLHLLESQLRKPNPTGKSYMLLRQLAQKKAKDGSHLLQFMYTTNYDQSIEQALDDLEVLSVSNSNARDIPRRPEQEYRCVVVHLHGKLSDRREDWFVTDSDELHEITDEVQNTILQIRFRDDLATKHLVFVGYSLSDINVKFLHYLVDKYSDSSQLDHYAVLPGPSSREMTAAKSAEWRLYQEIWQQRKVEFIDLRAEDFFENLVIQLETVECDALIEDLAVEFSRSPSEVAERARGIKERLALASIREALEVLRQNW